MLTRPNTIMIDSNAVSRLADGRKFCRLLGAVMQIVPFKVRKFTVISGLAFCAAMLPVAGHAFTQEDQQRLCTGDVFRLCSSEIPDVARITACMLRQKASLSPGCRSVFGKPSEQSAEAKQSATR